MRFRTECTTTIQAVACGHGDSVGGAEMIKTIHIGPHPLTVGGTQSVMRTISDFGIGSDQISLLPTWNGPKHLMNSVLVLHAAGAIIRADPGTIIHVHMSNGGAYVRDGPLIGLAKARRLKVVVSIHGFDFPEFASTHRRLVRSILSRADGILCLSNETKAALQQLGIRARIKRLPNPVAIDNESPPVGNTEPVALFAGTIGMRKGVDVLVNAWRMLLDAGIEGHCRLVGPIDDYQPPALERMTIEKAVDPRLIGPLIRSSRVVVLPSRAEGMPMILTEALAAGRPFVATPVGGTEELAPCKEMMVPVEDAAALARAIELFLVDRQTAQRVGSRCQEFCIETRGPEIIGASLRNFYQSL
jgi:glycosyltransferase involved in cell wall biosynthesis